MEILTTLGFTKIDINMIFLCPFFSSVGGIIHILMLSCNLSKWPDCEITDFHLPTDNKEKLHKALSFSIKYLIALPRVLINSPYWILARISLSALTGLIIALYFVGIFPQTAGGISRILILCISIGYMAPMLWVAKEKWIVNVIESKAFQERLLNLISDISDERDRKS